MRTMKKEMSAFRIHHDHVIYHKEQMRDLLAHLSRDEIVIKADFVQNIVHSRGRETSQAYYGKRQTQFLSFVVWYYTFENGEWTKHKLYIDYLSAYLKHNSLYFQKCVHHLLEYLADIGVVFNKVCFIKLDPTSLAYVTSQVWFDTDGGKAHFKSRFSFFFASTLHTIYGMFCIPSILTS
jgi:hypothetical protein